MSIIFLDTEFTDLLNPQLLSIGMVTLDGRRHYGELDLTTDAGRARLADASDFVLHSGVIDQWGVIAGAAGTEWELGRCAGEWLLELAKELGPGSRIEIAHDYDADYELLEYAIRDAGLWDQVREVVFPARVGPLTGSPVGEIAAEECFRELIKSGLARHHALADAMALRAAYVAVRATIVGA